jgi:hypothetical protein
MDIERSAIFSRVRLLLVEYYQRCFANEALRWLEANPPKDFTFDVHFFCRPFDYDRKVL